MLRPPSVLDPLSLHLEQALVKHTDAGDTTRIGIPVQQKLLTVYLSDHLAGATGAIQRLTQMTSQDAHLSVREELIALTSEVRDDRSVLLGMIRKIGVQPQRHKAVAGRFGEVLGRLKRNGRVWSRSPLTPLIEIEAIQAGVAGKLSLWQSLEAHANTLGLDANRLVALQDRARRQLLVLEECHSVLRLGAFEERT